MTTELPIQVSDNRVQCLVKGCGFKSHSLLSHLLSEHGLSAEKYLEEFPGSSTISKEFLLELEDESPDGHLRKATSIDDLLRVDIMGIKLKVDIGVDPLDCLVMPENYLLPTKGKAKGAIYRVLMALAKRRSVYIWGFPGTGKDAFIHYFSAVVRRPTVMLTFRPGLDISPWFYSRYVDPSGTGWEYGYLWKALVNGIKGKDGKSRAPLVLLSDVDRADEAQAEWFRILTDSISGRILGPDGKMQNLVVDDFGNSPQFAFTANSCGNGDPRGRMTSASPIDASIMDRLGRKVEAHYLDWEDEEKVLKAKFPSLPNDIFPQLEGVTRVLRDAIEKQNIFAEFTHRSLCDILRECEDILEFGDPGKASPNLLKRGVRAWLDGLDADNQFEARRLIDPHLKGGALSDGD